MKCVVSRVEKSELRVAGVFRKAEEERCRVNSDEESAEGDGGWIVEGIRILALLCSMVSV